MCFSKTNEITAKSGQKSFDIDNLNICDYEELRKLVMRNNNDFTIVQHNIRGINSKIGDIKYLIDNTYVIGIPDCMLLCETWLSPHSPLVKIAGYNFVHTDRVYKKGGGVGILIVSSAKYKERNDIKLDSLDCESCFIEVQTKNKPLIIGSIYRLPNSDINTFVSSLEKLLKKIKLEKNKHVVIGLDHNLDLLKSSIHKLTSLFAEMLLDNGMIPTITKPTRISKTMATLIDNILISEDLQEMYNSGILIDNCSDHLPCYTTLENILLSKKAPVRILGRDMRPKCMDGLKEKLKTESWDIDDNCSVDENFNNFHNHLTDLVNHFLPITDRIVCNKTLQREPWLTPGIMKSISKCKQLYHKMLKNSSPEFRTKYTEIQLNSSKD